MRGAFFRRVPLFLFTAGAVFFCGGVARLRAQEAGAATYGLDECIRIGLERSVPAANARRDQAIAETIVGQARSEALPQLSLKSSYSRLDEVNKADLGGESIELGSLDNYSAGAELSQLLYSGGRVNAALRAARMSRELAGWTRAEKEAALVRDIRTGFYAILLTKAAVGVRAESVEQLKALVAQAEQKYRNGRAAEFDVISAKVRLANEVPFLIQARNRYDLALESFRRLVNLAAGPFEAAGELACEAWKPDFDALASEAMAKRPALLAFQAVVRLREQDVIGAQSKGLPSLRATAAYNGAEPYGFVPTGTGWEWHWNAGLVLEWSLWDGGLTRNLVAEKKIELEKNRAELEDLKKSVQLEVRTAYLDMRHAAETVQASVDSVAMAEKALEIAKARYDAGLATRLEYTDANLALSTAKLSRFAALHEHMAAAARLRYAAGLGPDNEKKEERNP